MVVSGDLRTLSPEQRSSAKRTMQEIVSHHLPGTTAEIDFDIPTNYFSEGITTPGNQSAPGTEVADFGKPFLGSANDFLNKDWPGVLSVYNGSAGGNWLDLSATGLDEVSFVKFEVTAAGEKMYVDSVVGIPVPEPASAIVIAGVLSFSLTRRVR